MTTHEVVIIFGLACLVVVVVLAVLLVLVLRSLEVSDQCEIIWPEVVE